MVSALVGETQYGKFDPSEDTARKFRLFFQVYHILVSLVKGGNHSVRLDNERADIEDVHFGQRKRSPDARLGFMPGICPRCS